MADPVKGYRPQFGLYLSEEIMTYIEDLEHVTEQVAELAVEVAELKRQLADLAEAFRLYRQLVR